MFTSINCVTSESWIADGIGTHFWRTFSVISGGTPRSAGRGLEGRPLRDANGTPERYVTGRGDCLKDTAAAATAV